jgi:molybdopterin synthase catalytic subunit
VIELGPEPIDATRLLAAVASPSAGGVVLFLGTVRDHTEAKPVSAIEYQAHDSMARAELERVVAEALARWPGARVAAQHRTGLVKLGEASVGVAASAAHRAEAFTAARYVIDTLKERVPIWKKELSPEGDTWVHGEERVRSS